MTSRTLTIPEYIRVSETHWSLPTSMTLATWRAALAVAEQSQDRSRSGLRHAKAQWRAAQDVLRLAAEHGLAPEEIALEALDLIPASTP
jgi:hypothetical protein